MKFRQRLAGSTGLMAANGPSVLALTACGEVSGDKGSQIMGFPSSYVGPSSNFVTPTERDPNFEILKTIYREPYWVASLEMDRWDVHINPMLDNFERIIHYSFPETPPEYDTFELTGWAPATEEIKTAARDILSKFEKILDITFREVNDPKATNVISIGTSEQAKTAGFSYFPNNFFEIGMDVFISDDFSKPRFLGEFITNYDYEVLVHEIGHALGLKHPFEAQGTNTETLSAYEDNTSNTAMSYDEDTATFDGTLRPLDWMALTKFYGVKPSYNAGDDTYQFSSSSGTFILDGAGVDTISAFNTSRDVMIDLRPGAHSYLGAKSSYITTANQLTISHGSKIENVVTGSGNDTVIGTDFDNVISTGSGSDTIFAGGGADTIKSGTGADRIDLSESVQMRDTVKLTVPSSDLGVDTLYGFSQGVLGDILDVSEILSPVSEMFPLVISGSAPTANFGGGILRLVGPDVSNVADLVGAFQVGGGLDTLSISNSEKAIIISADSQNTGENQFMFSVESHGEEVFVMELAIFEGNALDIDQWHADNFNVIA